LELDQTPPAGVLLARPVRSGFLSIEISAAAGGGDADRFAAGVNEILAGGGAERGAAGACETLAGGGVSGR
jgi:hypothetical protein